MIMTYIFLKNNFIIRALSFAMIFLPSLAMAQGGLSFSVSPTIYDMTANPGQVWQSTVRIINPNPYDLTLSVTPNNFIPKDEDGVPQFVPLLEPTETKETFAEWIQIEPEITIKAEQTLELPFLIKVPEEAVPGGHYAALMISTKPAKPQSNGQVQTSQVISALVFLRVTGDITEQATIRSFRSANYFLSKPEARFDIRVENKGNIHLQPQGEIKIYNMWGKERGVIPINQQTMLGNVLPKSVRKFSFNWSSEWSISDIGRYTAKVTLAYGKEERQFLSSDTAFWIIPWKILLTLMLTIGGLIAFVTWAIKLYVKRVLALAGVHPVQTNKEDAAPVVTKEKNKRAEKTIHAKDITAPIEVSILDLRSKLRSTEGPWTERLIIYVQFIRLHWKFFAGVGATVLLIVFASMFVRGALLEDRAYEVTDPVTGEVISGSEKITTIQDGLGTQVVLVNRTKDAAVMQQVIQRVMQAGFIVSATSSESGAPDEKTVIVYNPDVVQQAELLSRVLQNALLSSYTSTATSSEKLVVYVGKDLVSLE